MKIACYILRDRFNLFWRVNKAYEANICLVFTIALSSSRLLMQHLITQHSGEGFFIEIVVKYFAKIPSRKKIVIDIQQEDDVA